MSYEEENDEIMMMLSSAGNRMAYSQPQPISSKQHRVSTDSGYDSMLSSHSASFTSSRSSIESSGDISSSLVSTTSSISPLLLSTTPVKKRLNETPTKSSILTADMSSLYLASIRSQQSQFLSPVKSSSSSCSSSNSSSCHFNHYSLSNSNSPLVYSGKKRSPKFAEPFVNERSSDQASISKLLKSPASRYSPYSGYKNAAAAPEIKIRTFSARLRSEGFAVEEPIEEDEPKKRATCQQRITPTEEQFMEMLYRNRHIPSDPYTLIGRHMGLEQMDMINELRDRSMHTIVDKILSYLSLGDLVRVSGVSRVWREAVRDNKRLNRELTLFVRQMRDRFHVTKENRSRTNSLLDSSINNSSLLQSPASMVNNKSSRTRRSSLLNIDLNSSNMTLPTDVEMIANSSSLFKPIDVNRLGPNGERTDFQRQPNLGAELLQAAGSLCLNTKANLPTSTAVNLSSFCQKLSPKKSTKIIEESTISKSPPRNTKFDVIGSKKSKKNLKRL